MRVYLVWGHAMAGCWRRLNDGRGASRGRERGRPFHLGDGPEQIRAGLLVGARAVLKGAFGGKRRL